MPLTEGEIEAAAARSRPYKLADGRGLVLFVRPTGAKWWRFRYRIDGREKMLSLGVYPDVSLSSARQRRDEARSLVAKRIDPSIARAANPRQHSAPTHEDQSKSTTPPRSTHKHHLRTLSAISSAWLETRRQDLGHDAWRRYRWVLTRHIIPQLGRRSIGTLKPKDVETIVEHAEASGHPEAARRVRQTMKQLIRYSLIHDLIDYSTAEQLCAGLH